jgi:FixJ family two-component response regulator
MNEPNGIDCYSYLKEHNYQGKMIFFIGDAWKYPLILEALKTPNINILNKPASLKEILNVIS